MLDELNNLINLMYESIITIPNLFNYDDIERKNSIENYNNYSRFDNKYTYSENHNETHQKQTYSEHYTNYNNNEYYYDDINAKKIKPTIRKRYNNTENINAIPKPPIANTIPKPPINNTIPKPQKNFVIMQDIPKKNNNNITIDFFGDKNNNYGQYVDIDI